MCPDNQFLNADSYTALLKAEQMLLERDSSFLRAAYYAFASENQALICRMGAAVRQVLDQFTMSAMIRLSEQFREYTSYEWYTDWSKVSLKEHKNWFASEEDYRCTLILGSFHPNGYFRERCIAALACCHDSLPYLILRINDWVKPIRDRAFLLVTERLKSCTVEELLYSTFAFQKVLNSGRRSSENISLVEASIIARISEELPDIKLSAISHYDFDVRKSIYKLLFSKRQLPIESLNYLLEKEKHNFCKVIIINGALNYYDCSMEQIEQYLKNKSSCIRSKALNYKYKQIKNTWPGIEDLLLDTNMNIREYARFILRRHTEFLVLDFYIMHLQDNFPITAIQGLSEAGSRKQADLLLPFLSHTSSKLVKTALLALSKLAGPDFSELYWDHLLNENVTISKAAFLALSNHKIRMGPKRIYDQFLLSKEEHVKRYLIHLMFYENSWTRLPWLLYLFVNSDTEPYRYKMNCAIGTRNVYDKLSKKLLAQLETAMEELDGALPSYMIPHIKLDLKYIAKEA